jgi:hypothetical protein
MISVTISINGNPIYTRSAVNQALTDDKGRTLYKVDDGSTIWHTREDGAVPLCIKLLKTIKEPRSGRDS